MAEEQSAAAVREGVVQCHWRYDRSVIMIVTHSLSLLPLKTESSPVSVANIRGLTLDTSEHSSVTPDARSSGLV